VRVVKVMRVARLVEASEDGERSEGSEGSEDGEGIEGGEGDEGGKDNKDKGGSEVRQERFGLPNSVTVHFSEFTWQVAMTQMVVMALVVETGVIVV
jgi:hypothetical protein